MNLTRKVLLDTDLSSLLCIFIALFDVHNSPRVDTGFPKGTSGIGIPLEPIVGVGHPQRTVHIF
jgi:hypothetical protein